MKNFLISIFAGVSLLGASNQAVAAEGYTINLDFKIEKVSAGICFAGSSVNDFYMWQINLENPSNPMFRPHRWVNNGPALLQEFSIADKVSLGFNEKHHLKIVVDNYNHASTYIDDTLIDERDGDFVYGMIGFRETHSDGVGTEEAAYFDNLIVTRHENNAVVMDEDFSDDNIFTQGNIVDGWLYVAGTMNWDCYAWGAPDNGIHFTMESDVTLVKDDVAFVFAEQDGGTYYMWALNCFDGDKPRIRHHIFTNGNLVWNDSEFDQFSKAEILGHERHVKIEVDGAYIKTYIDNILVDRYIDWSPNLKLGLVGFRIDTTSTQEDDAYIDNVLVTQYTETGVPSVILSEDFSNPDICWFPEAIVEEVAGNRKMHIYGDNVLYKWMQVKELSFGGYTINVDFEIGLYNVGLCFAGSKDLQNFYMWQINTVNSERPMLRPHKWTGNIPALFGNEVELPTSLNLTEGIHNLKLVITNNSSCSTYIDGILVDTRSGIFEQGLVGFREDRVDEKQSIESGYYSNLVITSNEDNSILYSCDFTKGNPFSCGEITQDGRLYVEGSMASSQYAWQCDYNDVWYTFEADMILMKDDVAFIFSHLDDANYYMWAVNAYDRDNMLIRRHVFDNGSLWFDDTEFTKFSKSEILEREHHFMIEVRGALIRTFIDDQLINSYINFSDKLVLAPIGIRIDTKAEQNDDAYIDDVKVTKYDAEGNPTVVLYDTFEPGETRWFDDQEVIVENVGGDNMMHIYGDNVLHKWMQISEAGVWSNGSSGIYEIGESATQGEIEYFNLQGVRVLNPSNGIFIVKDGNKVIKTFIRK